MSVCDFRDHVSPEVAMPEPGDFVTFTSPLLLDHDAWSANGTPVVIR